MTDKEAQAEALWTYAISQEKILRQFVKRGVIPQEEADWMSDRLYEQLNLDDVPGFRVSKLGEMMRSEHVSPHEFVSLIEIAREKQTLTPSLWINTTKAMGMKTSRGKGGGTTAHPEIAIMFRAWLFPEFMLELVKWYRGFHKEFFGYDFGGAEIISVSDILQLDFTCPLASACTCMILPRLICTRYRC